MQGDAIPDKPKLTPAEQQRVNLLALMESTKDAVASFTGIKQQFIDAGWSPEAAEQMVIELFRKTPAPTF